MKVLKFVYFLGNLQESEERTWLARLPGDAGSEYIYFLGLEMSAMVKIWSNLIFPLPEYKHYLQFQESFILLKTF